VAVLGSTIYPSSLSAWKIKNQNKAKAKIKMDSN